MFFASEEQRENTAKFWYWITHLCMIAAVVLGFIYLIEGILEDNHGQAIFFAIMTPIFIVMFIYMHYVMGLPKKIEQAREQKQRMLNELAEVIKAKMEEQNGN